MNVPACVDILQKISGSLETPEIRVWCHPRSIRQDGDDYCKTFSSFNKAMQFIKTHKEAESVPLIAFRGYELNIWGILPENCEKGN